MKWRDFICQGCESTLHSAPILHQLTCNAIKLHQKESTLTVTFCNCSLCIQTSQQHVSRGQLKKQVQTLYPESLWCSKKMPKLQISTAIQTPKHLGSSV